jgi:hypothetical protein
MKVKGLGWLGTRTAEHSAMDDVAAVQTEMEAAGIEFFSSPESAPEGYSWSHFHAPDGNVYEIMSGPEGG